MAIKTAKELAAAAKAVAQNHKTLYVMGCFGAPMTAKNKARYTRNLAYNRQTERTVKINAATANTFGFDCICFIKGLLWGWDGDPGAVYGGATYKSNGVPDKGADQVIKLCSGVSTDFSKIQVGEYVYMPGHCGIYIGNGLAVEATPIWKDGVQITAVGNIGQKAGYNTRTWTKHGKLPWVTYDNIEEKPQDPVAPENLYRVTVEGLPKATAENLAKSYTDIGFKATVEEIKSEKPPVTKPAEPAPQPAKPWVPTENDIVRYKGGTGYSNANAKTGKKANAGLARITKIVHGAKHPYHLKRTGDVGPYAWVDAGTFTKA